MTRSSTLTLRAEGLALGAAATALFAFTDASWWLYGGLLLVPDVAMAGYWLGPRIGAAIYNAAHSTLAPLSLAALGWLLGLPLLAAIALIWLAHIGFDRALGYGLKEAAGFRHTHLGELGSRSPETPDHLVKQST